MANRNEQCYLLSLANKSVLWHAYIEMYIAIQSDAHILRYGRDFMEAERLRNAAVSLEPYVDSNAAGEFLGLHPVTVMRLAREGHLPGHPVRNAKRRQWRDRKSVV